MEDFVVQQRQVRYRGNVQGVGFRYTTYRIAGGHNVTGTVQNLPDGSVKLVAEGEPSELDAFLEEIRQRMDGYIREENVQEAPASDNYTAFRIVH